MVTEMSFYVLLFWFQNGKQSSLNSCLSFMSMPCFSSSSRTSSSILFMSLMPDASSSMLEDRYSYLSSSFSLINSTSLIASSAIIASSTSVPIFWEICWLCKEEQAYNAYQSQTRWKSYGLLWSLISFKIWHGLMKTLTIIFWIRKNVRLWN